MPYNPYAPLQRGLENIGGTLERGGTRKSQHLTRMGLLDLRGRRLGMEEERFGLAKKTHGLETELKGLQIGKLAREETDIKARRALAGQPSEITDINKVSDFLGEIPEGESEDYWVEKLKAVIPDTPDKHIKVNGKLVGFGVTKGEEADIYRKIHENFSALDWAKRGPMLRKMDGMLGEAGADPKGARPIDQKRAAVQQELGVVTTMTNAFAAAPLKGIAAHILAFGEKAATKIYGKGSVKQGKAYLKKQTALTAAQTGGLTTSQLKTQEQRLRTRISKLNGASEWNKMEPDIAVRAARTSTRANELMKDGVPFDKAAETAFLEDSENIDILIEKQYPDAYKGEDGQWYLDKEDKTYRIKPTF